MTTQPFVNILHLLSLPPDKLFQALSLLASFMILSELLRISLLTTLTRSAPAHVAICLLTFAVQAIALAFVLVYADTSYPGRGWINLGFALALYLVWFLTGEATKLVRKDSEGADLGFMAVGALLTFPTGIIAALVC
jgi:hypothetical protein